MDRDWNSIMFDDIGVKIQTVAKTVAWLNIALSFVAGLVVLFLAFLDLEYFFVRVLMAIIVVIVGCLISWLSSIALYAFGQLVEDIHAMRNAGAKASTQHKIAICSQQPNDTPTDNIKSNLENVVTHKWRCDNCGNMRTQTPCEYCQTKDNLENTNTVKQKNPNALPCPWCGEDLTFMGWNDTELQEKQTCPLCGKEVLLK